MALRTTVKMPSFEGVAAGQTATLRCPIGQTYHALLVTYSGVTLAQMTAIRVLANGKPIMRFASGTQLDLLNKFEGRAAAAGIIVIDFERFGLLTRAGRELTALGTGVPGPGQLSTLTVEIDIDAAAAAPVLSAKAQQSAARALGLVKFVDNFSYTPGGTGDYEIADLPKGNIYNKVSFDHTGTAVVTAGKVERDRFTVFERTEAENNLLNNDGVRVAQTGLFVFDPTEAGHGAEGLVTAGVGDLRFTLTVTTAGNIPVIVESLGPLAA